MKKEKQCSVCKNIFDISNFYKNKARKDGYQTYCKVCHYHRNKKYYRANPDIWAGRQKIATKISREFILTYLQNNSCVDCGEPDPVVLEFDHIKGEKTHAISRMITLGLSLERIKKEMDKCVVRCANCHRRKTAKEKNWYRFGK